MTRIQLNNLILAANGAGLRYVFVDKTPETLQLIKETLIFGDCFTFLVGQGDCARIKISW